MYSKPTDTHQYLHYGSCHPRHVKKGIPCGQALRMKRICTTKETYNRIEMLQGNFEKRVLAKVLLILNLTRPKETLGTAYFVRKREKVKRRI